MVAIACRRRSLRGVAVPEPRSDDERVRSDRARRAASRNINSGACGSNRGRSRETNPTHVLPAPSCIAARPARIGAPLMPSAPPMIESVPNVPLCTLRLPRRSASGNAAASAGQSSRYPADCDSRLERRCRAGESEIAPQRSTPSPVRRPGFSAMNVAVRVARTAGAKAAPVSASSPLGTSSARIGAPMRFAQSISARVFRGGPAA